VTTGRSQRSSYERESAFQEVLADGGRVITKASKDVNGLSRSTDQSDQSMRLLATLELGIASS
jgi:hypothetical protein